jgi:hypothetical protein
VVIALAPALAYTILTRGEARRVAEAHARDSALRVVRLAADRHQRLLESTRQMLFLLSRLPALRSGDLETSSRLFADLVRQYPRYANLGIAQLDGNIAASGVPLTQPFNAAGHSWFQRLAENPDLESEDYQLDEISGKPAVVLSHPVLESSGKMNFVAFAALDLGWVNQIFNAAQFPAGAVMTVSDAGGRILARTLDASKWAGSPGPEAGFLKDISPGRDATAESPGVDGVRRIYAFTQLPGRSARASAYVSVGIPADAAYADADAAFSRSLAVLGLTGLLTLAAVAITGEMFLGRGLRDLKKTMQRISSGDLGARTASFAEVAEVRETARALDGMAEATRTRSEESRRALDASREMERRFRLVADRLPALAWSTDVDLATGFILGEGLAGQRPQESNYRGLSIGTCLQAIAPGFEATPAHTRALKGERVSGEIQLAQGTARYQIAPLKNPQGEIIGCVGLACDDSPRKQAEHEQSDRAQQLNQALDAAIEKITEYRRSEEAMQQEIRHLKEALRATARETAEHARSEELLQQRELELREFLESAGAEAARLKREGEEAHVELKQARSALESAAAEADLQRAESQQLSRRTEHLAADLEAAAALNAELKRREEAARENEQQARMALEAANAELGRRTQTDAELRESAKQINFALEAAASEVTELQEEVEGLRENEKHLRETLQSAETKNHDLQRALESAVADLDRHKRSTARTHPKELLSERQALAQKLNDEASGSLATIKSRLEAMQKMAGKSPLALRLRESIETLDSTRHRLRNLAKGLAAPGGA